MKVMSKVQILEMEDILPQKSYSEEDFDVVYSNDEDLLLLDYGFRTSKTSAHKELYAEKRPVDGLPLFH